MSELPSLLEDGDAILRTSDDFFTALNLPPNGVRPMEVWAVRRLALVSSGSGRFTEIADHGLSLQVREADGLLFVSSGTISGTWTAVAGATPDERPHLLGEVSLQQGTDAFLGVGSATDIRSLQLFSFARTTLR